MDHQNRETVKQLSNLMIDMQCLSELGLKIFGRSGPTEETQGLGESFKVCLQDIKKSIETIENQLSGQKNQG